MGYRTKEARRANYLKNIDKNREKCRKYREKNKEKIRATKLAYESQPHRRELKREKSKKEYLASRDKVLLRQKLRRQERKIFIDNISLKYGCQNPNCKWQGEFDPCQLTFHHFDPQEKEIEIAKMHSWSFENIVKEINKCVVYCRNCHPLADKGNIVVLEEMMCKENVPGVK